MRGLTFLCILLALPALAALGHDIYLTYSDQDFNKTMMFSDIGYIWTHYNPETYNWAKKNADPVVWEGLITPFLEQTTVIVAAIPAVGFYLALLVMKLFNIGPFGMGGYKRGQFGYAANDKGGGRFKYKRK